MPAVLHSVKRTGVEFTVTLFLFLLAPALHSADLPLLYDGCTVRVPAQVAGKTAYLIFDTGSTVSALDKAIYQPDVRDRVGGGRTSSISGVTAIDLYRCPQIVLGDVVAAIEKIAAVDLSRIAAISGSQCDGILGTDFAQHHVVSIDFDKQLFGVESKINDAQSAHVVRLGLKPIGNGNFAVNATVEGVPLSLMIDTGDNGSVSLNAEDWRRVINSHPRLGVHRILAAPMSGAPIETAAVRINDVSLGPNHYRDFVATAVPNPRGLSTLGLRFLRQHVVTFDFAKRQLILRCGSRFGEAEIFDMSGLHLVRSGDQTIVYAVDENSPGEVAGIKPGDLLEAIDRKRSATLTIWNIRRALKSKDGAALLLTVRHETDVTDRAIRLKKIL